MSFRANRLFLIILAALMALMTVWLDQISTLGNLSRELLPDQPEYVSEHIIATRFDAQGHIEQRLIAARMWQYPNSHELFFDTGYVRAFKADALDYSVTAESGHYNLQTKQAFFDRKVHMLKPAGPSQPESTLDTTAMSLDTVKRFASSLTPVSIHYGNSVANAIGFTYDYNAGIVNLLTHAKVTYVQ